MRSSRQAGAAAKKVQAQSTDAPAGGDAASAPRRLANFFVVLIVDDNEINRRVSACSLMLDGVDLVFAANGVEALDRYREFLPDVVLMDVAMPEMDGYGATAAIRALERAERLAPSHIVALTAHAMPGDREKCLAAGMDEYISKPVSPEDLRRFVERLQAETTPPGRRRPAD